MEYIIFIIKSIGAVAMVIGLWLACVTWKDITTELPWTKHHTVSYGMMILGAIMILSATLF